MLGQHSANFSAEIAQLSVKRGQTGPWGLSGGRAASGRRHIARTVHAKQRQRNAQRRFNSHRLPPHTNMLCNGTSRRRRPSAAIPIFSSLQSGPFRPVPGFVQTNLGWFAPNLARFRPNPRVVSATTKRVSTEFGRLSLAPIGHLSGATHHLAPSTVKQRIRIPRCHPLRW